MWDTIKIIGAIVLAVFEIVTAIVAVVKGLKNRKTSQRLSQVEQENDLYNYMVSQCSDMERFARVIKGSMSKSELAEYKRSQVMKNITLYAKANGYIWYCESVWATELEEYISSANAVSGKITATNK